MHAVSSDGVVKGGDRAYQAEMGRSFAEALLDELGKHLRQVGRPLARRPVVLPVDSATTPNIFSVILLTEKLGLLEDAFQRVVDFLRREQPIGLLGRLQWYAHLRRLV